MKKKVIKDSKIRDVLLMYLQIVNMLLVYKKLHLIYNI